MPHALKDAHRLEPASGEGKQQAPGLSSEHVLGEGAQCRLKSLGIGVRGHVYTHTAPSLGSWYPMAAGAWLFFPGNV